MYHGGTATNPRLRRAVVKAGRCSFIQVSPWHQWEGCPSTTSCAAEICIPSMQCGWIYIPTYYQSGQGVLCVIEIKIRVIQVVVVFQYVLSIVLHHVLLVPDRVTWWETIEHLVRKLTTISFSKHSRCLGVIEAALIQHVVGAAFRISVAIGHVLDLLNHLQHASRSTRRQLLCHMHPRVYSQAYSCIHLLLLKQLLFQKFMCWYRFEATSHGRPHKGTHGSRTHGILHGCVLDWLDLSTFSSLHSRIDCVAFSIVMKTALLHKVDLLLCDFLHILIGFLE
jgi:hypothetical protein